MNANRTRPARGIRLTHRELQQIDVIGKIGARFETDKLDIFPALYEVIELNAHGAVVVRISRTDGAPAMQRSARSSRGHGPGR